MKYEPEDNFLSRIPGLENVPRRSTAEEEAAADARALADLEQGRTIGHEAVVKWLSSWGTGNRLPRPQTGD